MTVALAGKAFCLVAALALCGCRAPAPNPLDRLPPVSVDDKPSELQLGYRILNAEGGRNYVVNQMEIGMDALQLGHLDLSARAFDAGLDAIETVYGEDAAARQARKLWHSEGRKTFKGEPYERAMTYFYRGLLYIMDGDLENARACFRGGQFQDAFVEEEQHRSDFATFLYLDAWCSLMLRDPVAAQDPIRFLKELRPDVPVPTAEGNLLIVGETGTAPLKLATGSGGAELVYARGKGFREKRVRMSVEGRDALELYPIEDVYWQASTRGGRPVDRILKGKVVFKERWDSAGSTLTQLGATGMMVGSGLNDRHDRNRALAISAGVTAIGALAQVVAEHVNARADTRRFRSLPDAVHVAAVPCPEQGTSVWFEFLDDAGELVKKRQETAPGPTDSARGALVWCRSPLQFHAGK